MLGGTGSPEQPIGKGGRNDFNSLLSFLKEGRAWNGGARNVAQGNVGGWQSKVGSLKGFLLWKEKEGGNGG